MKLNPGDKVGIISPSSFLLNRETIAPGLDYLRSLKLEPVLGDHVFDTYHTLLLISCGFAYTISFVLRLASIC